MFHAACSCTFLEAHLPTEVYSVTPMRLRSGWLRLKMRRSLCSQDHMFQAATVCVHAQHTHWIPLSELGLSTSPGENTNIAAAVLFASRGWAQAPVACVAIVSGSLCRLCTITLNRMEKAGGQRFHAAYSCTFLVAHWSTEPNSAMRTKLQYGCVAMWKPV